MKRWLTLRIEGIILLASFLIGGAGFLYFEKMLLLKIVFLILLLFLLWWHFRFPSSRALIYLFYFLLVWNVLNLYFTVSFAYAHLIFLLLILALSFLYTIFFRIISFWWSYVLLYLVICLEIYLGLSFWPTDPYSKSMMILLAFYIYWEMVLAKGKTQSFWSIISVALILFFLILVTTSWYNA